MNPSKELVCKENRKVFRLYTNGVAFSKTKLDDRQDNEHKKCDYLITKDTKDIQIFIELKGNKVANAFEQILTSYKNTEHIENMQIKYYAAIVCSRIPQTDSTIQNLQKDANNVFKKVFIKSREIKTQYDTIKCEITDKLAGMAKY